MIPLEAFEGGKCWAFISRNVLKLSGNSPLTCFGEQDMLKDISLAETGHKTSDLPEFAALSSQNEEWPRGTPGQKLGGPAGCIV